MIITFGLLGVVVLSVLVYYFGAFYPKFNKLDKKKEFLIPGLEENFVPQGMDYVENKGVILVSGYMSDGKPSRVYVIKKATNEVEKFVTFKNLDGTDYVGHAGGVASDGDSIWVVGDKKLFSANYSDLESGINESVVSFKAETITGNGCDFVDVYNNKLVVGEFYRKEKYETPIEHYVEVSANETNHALAFVYELNNARESGISENIEFAISLPDQAQGIAFIKIGETESVLISTSWSIPSSRLHLYSNPLNGNSARTILIDGADIPVYELNSNNKLDEIKAPAMSEELTVVDGRVFVLFESACNKYKMVNRTRTKNALSIKL